MVGTLGFDGELGMVITPTKPIIDTGLNPQEPSKPSYDKETDVCDRMAKDAQRIADAAIIGNPMKDRPDLSLAVFNHEFGMFTFGSYLTPDVLGALGTQASGRQNVLCARSYQGSGGFPPQFRDSRIFMQIRSTTLEHTLVPVSQGTSLRQISTAPTIEITETWVMFAYPTNLDD